MTKKHNMDSLIEHLKTIGAYQNPNEKLNIQVTNNLIKSLKSSYPIDLNNK
jgi:hypothetical protein